MDFESVRILAREPQSEEMSGSDSRTPRQTALDAPKLRHSTSPPIEGLFSDFDKDQIHDSHGSGMSIKEALSM